jgi:hypothetical protein
MDDGLIWGILTLAYIIPFPIWLYSREQTIEARKQLYPGRPEETKQENKLLVFGLVWILGLAVLLGGWVVGWEALETAVTIGGLILISAFLLWLGRRFSLVAVPYFRYWIAGSIVWLLAVGSWHLVFGRSSDLRGDETLLLALLPPFVGLIGIVAISWAGVGRK